jgi:hypothetical protein
MKMIFLVCTMSYILSHCMPTKRLEFKRIEPCNGLELHVRDVMIYQDSLRLTLDFEHKKIDLDSLAISAQIIFSIKGRSTELWSKTCPNPFAASEAKSPEIGVITKQISIPKDQIHYVEDANYQLYFFTSRLNDGISCSVFSNKFTIPTP